jgi:hypothetical protein
MEDEEKALSSVRENSFSKVSLLIKILLGHFNIVYLGQVYFGPTILFL